MVRLMAAEEAGTVADIWLAANLDAHGFIPAEYWRGCQSAVREAIAASEAYVYEGPEGIEGFIGLEGEHIAGLFVRSGSRSRGLGHALLEAARAGRAGLRLSVYEKNAPARRFYEREGFRFAGRGLDGNTGEAELAMIWRRA